MQLSSFILELAYQPEGLFLVGNAHQLKEDALALLVKGRLCELSGVGAAIDGGQDVHEIASLDLLVDSFEGGCGDSDLVLVTWLHLSQEIIN